MIVYYHIWGNIQEPQLYSCEQKGTRGNRPTIWVWTYDIPEWLISCFCPSKKQPSIWVCHTFSQLLMIYPMASKPINCWLHEACDGTVWSWRVQVAGYQASALSTTVLEVIRLTTQQKSWFYGIEWYVLGISWEIINIYVYLWVHLRQFLWV